MDYNKFYKQIFSKIEQNIGLIDEETITTLVGFSVGGPVSLSQIEAKKVFVTCELAHYPEQKKSTENLNYEFMSIGDFDMLWCRKVFTSLGVLSMSAVLGDGHTVNISEIVDSNNPVKSIRLKLYSNSIYENKHYGIYQVLPN